MKVLVTGSSGLVGSALQLVINYHKSSLGEENHEYIYLTSKDGDLTKEYVVKELFEKYSPDALIHLAANVGGLFKNMNCRAEMLEDNLLMNTFLLKYARIHKLQKVIVLLSTCIFPDGVEPLVEDALHKGPPHPSNEGYAYAKRIMEVHSRILSEQHEIPTICLTPTNIYGPYDNYNLANAHVIPALIHKCYLAKQNKELFVVKGSGKPLRQFIYSLDLAEIIRWMLHSPITHGHFICSPPSTTEVSIEHVARKIAQTMEYEYALAFDTSFSDGQYKKTVEPHPILKDITFTDFDQGIVDSVNWFLHNVHSNTIRL